MYKSIVISSENAATLLPKINSSKDTTSRLRKFVDYLDGNNLKWLQPNLMSYRDYLLSVGLSAASTAAHLSTIRSTYQRILKDNDTRDKLYMAAGNSDIVTKKIFVDEMLTRLSNEIDPKKSTVKVTVKQDLVDEEHLRLTKEQVLVLINAPDISLHGIRDRAMLALMVCTGLREAELCSIEVDDLYQVYQGEPCLLVRRGKGNKQRVILYGGLKDFALGYVENWLSKASIKSGAVFRAVSRNETKVSNTKLTTRMIQNILSKYPILINGTLKTVKPHDLRRTYAKLMFDNNMRLEAIKSNLGHSDVKTTLGYIGALDASIRQPPSIF